LTQSRPDDYPPPIALVSLTLSQTCRLQTVNDPGDGTTRQPHQFRELSRGYRSHPVKEVQTLKIGRIQANSLSNCLMKQHYSSTQLATKQFSQG
jgi:hypothetical protein